MSHRCMLLFSLAAFACAPADHANEAVPQEVTFRAADFSFTGPDTIRPGMTTFRMVNDGQLDHHIILARLADGRTTEELFAILDANAHAIPDFVTWHGVANVAAPGASVGATVDLPEGTYALLCLIPDPRDGVPHLHKGMSRTLVVTGEWHEAPAPAAVADIRMMDFGYVLPDLRTGTHTFRMINDGPQPHEAQLVRLNDGASAMDFLAALAPGATAPPPGVFMGGSGALSAGLENWWTVTLEPGRYAVICLIPDPASGGIPHFVHGMVTEFSVGG